MVFFTLTYCTTDSKHLDLGTDLDQLYALQYDNHHKDSLAETLDFEVESALALKNTAANRLLMDSILRKLRWTNDSIDFKKLSTKAIDYAIDKGDKYFLASTYNNIGMYYHDLYQLDSTYYYYLKTENVYKSLKDTLKLGEGRFYQARLLFEMGLFRESEAKVAQALSFLKKYPNTPVHYEANQLMSLCLSERKEYSEGQIYLRKALQLMLKDKGKYKILDKKRSTMAITMLYGNLSELSYLQMNYKEARDYALEGHKYVSKNTHPILVSFINNNRAKSGYQLFKNPIYLEELIKCYDTDSTLNYGFRMYYTAIDLAKLYQSDGDCQNANKWGDTAYGIATHNKVLPWQVEALEFLLLNDDYTKKDEVKLLIQLRQTLSSQENTARDQFARIAYETESIEEENSRLKEIIAFVVIVAIALLFALVIFIFYIKLKAKNKELKFEEEQRVANENISELMVERNFIGNDILKRERGRIAKDLHDGNVNTIFTIRFNLQLLETNNPEAKELLVKELHKLEDNTRNISHDLMENLLFKENSFIKLLEEHIRLQVNSWNTAFDLQVDKAINWGTFDSATQVNLFFIVKEAIQNVNKYSKAEQCIISFTRENDSLKLVIKDNGVGFDSSIKNKGLGIDNMHERAKKINGELMIKSKRNKGTMVVLKVSFLK
jgi:signal transduction histidine kinase